jgi:hypothetical protein
LKLSQISFVLDGEFMNTETITFSIAVNPAPPPTNPFSVTDASGDVLTDGETITLLPETVGILDPGQVLFEVKGGTPPYTYQIVSGSLPEYSGPSDGLSKVVNSDGSETVSLSGTPSAPSPTGGNSFAIQISDSAGSSVVLGTKAARK